MESDQRAHTRALGAVLALAVAADLNDRIKRFDGRLAARARVGEIKAYNTASGSTGYSFTITQTILPDVPEDKRKKIQMQQSTVKAKLATKNGIGAYLAAGGVH